MMEDEFLVTKLPSGAYREEIVQFFKKRELPYRVSSKINDLTGFVQYARVPQIRSNEGFSRDSPEIFTPSKIGGVQRQVEEHNSFPEWKSNQRDPLISQGNSVPKSPFGGIQHLAAEHNSRTFQSNPSGLNPLAVQGTSALSKIKSGFGDSHFSSFSTRAPPGGSSIKEITGSPEYRAIRPQAPRRFLMGATPEARESSVGSWSLDSTENEPKKQATPLISQTVQPPQTPFSLRKGFEKQKVVQKTEIVEDLVKQKEETPEEKQPPHRIAMEITPAGSKFKKSNGSSSMESTVKHKNPPYQGSSVPKSRLGGFQHLAAEHSRRTFQSNPSGVNPLAVQGTSALSKIKSGSGDSHFSSFSTSAPPGGSSIKEITRNPEYGASRPQAPRRFLMGATHEARESSIGSWSLDSTENEPKKQATPLISQTVQPPQTPFSMRKGFAKKKVAEKTGIVEDLVRRKMKENPEQKQPPRRIVSEITPAGSKFKKNNGSSSMESEHNNPPCQPSQFAMPEFSLGKGDEPSVKKDAEVEDLQESEAVEGLEKKIKKDVKGFGGSGGCKKTGEKQAESKKTSMSKEREKTVESLIGTASFFAHLEQIATESRKTSPYRCDVCARQFTSLYNLRSHRVMHED